MSINNSIPRPRLRWNNFNLSHNYDTSGRFGDLIPVQVTEVAPGDFFNEGVAFNIRLAPLSAPAMVRLNAHFHSFYVPYRIITPRSGQESTWEKFINSIGKPKEEVPVLPKLIADQLQLGDDPTDTSFMSLSQVFTGSLWDYLKLPAITTDEKLLTFGVNPNYDDAISLLPFLSCLKIWNDWYRRDQVEPEVVFPLDLGVVDCTGWNASDFTTPEDTASGEWYGIDYFMTELLKLRTRNYERDYFTSGLPQPQYGEDVTIGDAVDIYAAASASISLSGASLASSYLRNSSPSNVNVISSIPSGDDAPTSVSMARLTFNGDVLRTSTSQSWSIDNATLDADIDEITGLQAAPSFTVNELRLAMQLQGVRERINRGGTRYVEIMQNIYGVSINDLRLQRPQYLGGVKAPLTIGAVLQTSESDKTPQGTMTGQGGAIGGDFLFRNKHMFDEHGLVITFMSITPRTGYTGGIPRMFRKFDPLEYYCPAFDHLGEQTTMVSELYDPLDGSVTGQEFAYNPHYQEYKSAYSTCTGEFCTTLDNWNVMRSFDIPPTLSPDFIHADSKDFDRIFAFENIPGTSNEHFYAQIHFDIKAKRNMSKYSTPFTFY